MEDRVRKNRPWITWAASLLFLAAAIAGVFAYLHWSRLEGEPPIRHHNGRAEVFLILPKAHKGVWLPLVESTDSPLLYLIRQGVAFGKVAQVNEDGTVLITDNEEGNQRAYREFKEELQGWPPP
jgi:hypothetical protein